MLWCKNPNILNFRNKFKILKLESVKSKQPQNIRGVIYHLTYYLVYSYIKSAKARTLLCFYNLAYTNPHRKSYWHLHTFGSYKNSTRIQPKQVAYTKVKTQRKGWRTVCAWLGNSRSKRSVNGATTKRTMKGATTKISWCLQCQSSTHWAFWLLVHEVACWSNCWTFLKQGHGWSQSQGLSNDVCWCTRWEHQHQHQPQWRSDSIFS